MPRSIPGPADLLDAVAAVGNGVGDALELVPRMGTLLDQAEALIGRVGRVLDRVESTVGSVEDTATRAGTLLELYADPLRTLAPSLRTFAERLDATEVEALIQLVDRLPILLKHLDEDIFPILTTLDRVAPDLHQLLEIAQDLQVALGGVPGMGWLRKKADKEEDEAERAARELEAITGKPAGKPKR